MIRIHHITLTRKQLDTVPEAERRLLVLIAHAANEINVLAKLFHFSASPTSTTPIFQQSVNAQSLVLARVLTGKLNECWKLLQTAFFRTALSKKYQPQFTVEASQALIALKRYFSRENIIKKVRNDHAFHYGIDQVDAGYRALVDGDPLDIYLANTNANTLYTFADTIVGRAMLECIKPGDHKAAFDILVDETSNVVNQINIVIGATIVICFKTYFGDTLAEMGANIFDINGAPNSQNVTIPYFIEVPN